MMKRIKRITLCFLMFVLTLSMATGVRAAEKKVKTFTSMDVDGNGTKDKVVVKAAVKDKTYASKIVIYVNNKKSGEKKVNDYYLSDLICKMIKTRDGSIFLLVTGEVFDGDSVFALFQYQSGAFTCVLTDETVIEAKDYIKHIDSITYKKGKDAASEKFVVRSVDTSNSLGQHVSEVVYVIKDKKLVKKSKIYTTKLTYYKTLTAATAIKVFKSATSKDSAFSLKKGDKVKVTKIYDSAKSMRIYVKRVSDGKKGWIAGVQNGVAKQLFEEVSDDDEEEIP